MRIAILEIAPTGHYTFVESLVQIYTTNPNNKIVIFTNETGKNILQGIESQQVIFCVKAETEKYSDFLKKIKNFDRLIITTLEVYTKELFEISTAFLQMPFNCPIDYTIHNIDMWFGRTLWSKVQNILFALSDFNNLVYQAKIQFKYLPHHKKIKEKVTNSKGHFIVLSEVLAKELAQFIDKDYIKVIPFSVFDKNLLDKSITNTKMRVCITGSVSALRRDYQSIFNILEKENNILKNCVEWDFLGGIHPNEGGKQIEEYAKKMIEIGYSIKIYSERFIDMKEFDENLSRADIVLGNMHLQQGATGKYGKSKETGVIFTMIKAAKVGLLPSEYACEPALKTSVLTFDNYEHLMEILLALNQNRIELARLKQEAKKNAVFYSPDKVYERINKL